MGGDTSNQRPRDRHLRRPGTVHHWEDSFVAVFGNGWKGLTWDTDKLHGLFDVFWETCKRVPCEKPTTLQLLKERPLKLYQHKPSSGP